MEPRDFFVAVATDATACRNIELLHLAGEVSPFVRMQNGDHESLPTLATP